MCTGFEREKKITQSSHPQKANKDDSPADGTAPGRKENRRGSKGIRESKKERGGVRSKDQKGTWTIPEKLLNGQTSRAPMSQIGAMQSVAAG